LQLNGSQFSAEHSLHILITVRTSSQGRRGTIDKSASQPVNELAIGGYYLYQEGFRQTRLFRQLSRVEDDPESEIEASM
jgi:hypothetical protein